MLCIDIAIVVVPKTKHVCCCSIMNITSYMVSIDAVYEHLSSGTKKVPI
jgi:hypothetical protein